MLVSILLFVILMGLSILMLARQESALLFCIIYLPFSLFMSLIIGVSCWTIYDKHADITVVEEYAYEICDINISVDKSQPNVTFLVKDENQYRTESLNASVVTFEKSTDDKCYVVCYERQYIKQNYFLTFGCPLTKREYTIYLNSL